MADGNEPARLHPDDLEAMAARVAAILSANVAIPPPALPPSVINGYDLRSIKEVAGPDTTAVERLIRAFIQQAVAGFKTEDQIVSIVDGRLERVGMLMDQGHIEETGDAIRGAMKWHKLTQKLWIAGLVGVVSSLAGFVASKFGLPPSSVR